MNPESKETVKAALAVYGEIVERTLREAQEETRA